MTENTNDNDNDIKTGLAGLNSQVIPDALSLTFSQKLGLEQQVIDSISMMQTSVAGIDSAEQLRRRVAECVHWNTCCASPVSTAYLNRLFGRVAHRLGLNVSGIVQLFIQSGRFVPFGEGPRSAVVATKVWNEVLEQWKGFDDNTVYIFKSNWTDNIK